MAYPNPFPVTYPQMGFYPQMQMQPPQLQAQAQQAQMQAQQNGMVWVQGEAGAKSYLLTPNTILPLWDSEAQTIYLKSTDASGMPTMKILDYTVRDSQQNNPPIQNNNAESFATKEEVESLAEQLASMKRRLDGMSQRHRKPEKQKEVVDNE